jgi:hypothetical protein
LLGEYCQRIRQEEKERKQSEGRKLNVWKSDKINRLQQEIDSVTKHNQILASEVALTEK